jgi:hypothetical protein
VKVPSLPLAASLKPNNFTLAVDKDGNMTMQQYYDIKFNDGKSPITVERPDELPQPGDILIFTQEYHTPAPQEYSEGDEIHLHERTDEAPFGKTSELGNWRAISKYGVSIWSNIEWMLATGTLKVRE